MKERFKNFFLSEKGVLLSIFVFVFLNWLVLINIEKLTHPDYYNYYAASQKLFSGSLELKFIPPLFPFLLGLFGRLLSLFTKNIDSYILAGRIISLIAGLGVIYFSYKLLATFVRGYAILGSIFLVVSPFFLKLLSIPQTDMLYLFFVSAVFYFLAGSRLKTNLIWPLTCGILTRFEGILLLVSTYVNYFKVKGKRWLYFTISLIPLTLLLYFFFLKFFPRIIEKIAYVFSKGYYLYYFEHPGELAHLFYGNFLYFVSPKFPGFLKWLFLYVLLFCFLTGIYFLFKSKRQFALAIILYGVIFIIFKGYAASLDPEVEFRRMFSVVWIFFIAAFVGIYYIFKKIRELKIFSISCRSVLACFLIITALFLPYIKGTWLLLFLVLIPALIYGITRFKGRKIELTALLLILLFSSGQFYYDAGKRAYRYVERNTNKAGFVIGQWLSSSPVQGNVLVYSYLPMVRYYLEKPGKINIVHYIFLKEKVYKNRDRLMLSLLRKAKRNRVKYIVFDGFLNPEEGDFRVAIYTMLYDEKELLHREDPKSKDSYFRLIKTLKYKGKPVAWVLKPIYEKVPKKKLR